MAFAGCKGQKHRKSVEYPIAEDDASNAASNLPCPGYTIGHEVIILQQSLLSRSQANDLGYLRNIAFDFLTTVVRVDVFAIPQQLINATGSFTNILTTRGDFVGTLPETTLDRHRHPLVDLRRKGQAT